MSKKKIIGKYQVTINLGELSEDHHISEEDYILSLGFTVTIRQACPCKFDVSTLGFSQLKKRLGEGKISLHNFPVLHQMRMKLGMGIILWVEICSNW